MKGGGSLAVVHLLDTIRPERYQLTLHVATDWATFSATEFLEFGLGAPTTTITLHAVGLDVTDAEIDGNRAQTITYDVQAQTVSFEFGQALAAGQQRLKLAFTGPIQDSLHGFYRAAYDHQGSQAWFLMTQFEAIHAREALVCVDEPAAKAVFEISLEFPDQPGLTALSNTPVASDEVIDGLRRVNFEPTPKMSTYLLAWVVSQLAETHTTTNQGVLVGIYATPGHAGSLDYARESAVRILEHYEAYFGIPYPLPKLDLVACPNFAAAAMENWGLVTYRETDLLVDAVHTSLANKQRVIEVIAHELAHQWFGDLVTMAWWEDLWLNESFASWAETMTVNILEPEWQWWTEYTVGLGSYARELDSLINTHPILVEVPDPKGLDEIFDAISYFKGQGLIRMLEAYLGPKTFQKGLQGYIQAHAYSNATTADLWAALSQAAGLDVAALMETWTTAPGFPMVSYSKDQMTVERFVASPREARKLASSSVLPTWHIPWSAVYGDTHGRPKTLPPVLVDNINADLPVEIAQADWFKPNPGEQGFWRSRYNEQQLSSLRIPLQERLLSVADRYGVIADVWASVSAGHMSTGSALELVAALRDEPDYYALVALLNGFGDVLAIVEDQAVRDQLKSFGKWLVSAHYERLGWQPHDTDTHFDTLLRPVVLAAGVRFDVPGAGDRALELFGQYVSGQDLDANIRSAVLYGAARSGGEPEYEQMLALYKNETAPQARQAQLVNLGRFRDAGLAQRSLDMAMSNKVKSQDLVYGLAGVWRTREHRELAWNHLQVNWPELVKRYGEGGHMLDRFPDFAGDAFATSTQADMVAAFFAKHPHVLIDRPVAQAVETIRLKADWYDRDRQAIANFITSWIQENKALGT